MKQSRRLIYAEKFPKTPIPPREDNSTTKYNSRKKYTPGDWVWLLTIFLVLVILLLFIIKSWSIKIELKDWGIMLLLDLLITKDCLKSYRDLK